jgi:hypothetical protein
LKRIEFLKGDHFKFSLKFGERFWVTQQINWRPKEYCKHHRTEEAHECYYISCDTAIWASKQGWKWRVNLPPPETRDENENWNEEMKEDFSWYFGSLLETVQQKELFSEQDIEYYNY